MLFQSTKPVCLLNSGETICVTVLLSLLFVKSGSNMIAAEQSAVSMCIHCHGQ